ncbi:MAG: tape measure protein [Alphaproteobacteria bacterium]|nr:tape measure protein [Alphaproteobacteria bacterium]
MPRFAEAKFTIRAINKTQKAFSQINTNVQKMEGRFSKLGRGLSKIGGLMATVFVGRQIVDVITKFEKLEASLRTVTGSADKAALAFGFIQEFAATTPFQLEEVTDAFIKLKALGLTPSAEALTSYGNTAVAMGKSLNQMIEAVADATTGEFERLKEFGIKSKSQGDQVTFTFQGIATTVGKNAKEIEGYLRSIGDVQFSGAMDEQADTLNVALSNMGDSFSKLVKAIGDAGLTDILQAVANAIKWVAEQITKAVPIMKLGFAGMVIGVEKFVNSFIARLIGMGRAIAAFFDNIGDRFEAFGRDIAAFFDDPLAGVSLDNTKRAFQQALGDSMSAAYNEMVETAKEKNAELDKEMMASADAFIQAQQKKRASLDSLFEETGGGGREGSGDKQDKVNKATEKFTKLQREAQRIIDATRTPLERYNKEMELLNKLLKEGHINQATFGRATEQAQEKLKKSSEKMGDVIEGEFEGLGKSMEGSIADALDGINGRFDSFGDFAKGFLSDLNRSLLQFALKDLGITGEGGLIGDLFGSIGGLFKGGGSGGGGFGSLLSSVGSFFGGFFADGGTLKPGQFGVVGERGPELAFAGNSPLSIMPNGAAPVTVNMNIQTPDVQSFRQSQGQLAADMARSIDRARRNL